MTEFSLQPNNRCQAVELWTGQTEYPVMAKRTTGRGPYDKAGTTQRPGAENRIGAWRRFRGLTQAALSEKVDLSPGTISDIEKAKIGFSAESLGAISKALNVPRGKLLDEEPPPKARK